MDDRSISPAPLLGPIVALETSTRPGSVAARALGRTLNAGLSGTRPHASDLLPALEPLLAELGLAPGDIRVVAVGTGPGSYTGLRVGLASAFGLARAVGASLVGVPSFAALALGALAPGEEGVVLEDARAGAFYFAHYAREGESVRELAAPRAVTAAELGTLLPARIPILCDADPLQAAGLGAAERARLRSGVRPRAEHVLALGLRRLAEHGPDAPEDLAPLYLRSFAARTRRR